MQRSWPIVVSAIVCFVCAESARGQAPALDADDIGGIVTGAKGPEAGVWVIAETDAFDTRFAKIVVTDDHGRYVIPDLPKATYSVWVRGYGLADSHKMQATPGRQVNLQVSPAQNATAAAQIYPAAYWYSMMKLPQEHEVAHLPGKRNEYLMWMKNMACVGCHQMGNLATRTIPPGLGKFDSSHDAWVRRIQSGQAGAQMTRTAMGQLGGVPIKYLADWTDRIAAGEAPAAQPDTTQRRWNATSSRPYAIGPTRRRTCMICPAPIVAIRP